ncbi:hypothetical protein QEN19_004261 [Hanseniaspora menglaensis]
MKVIYCKSGCFLHPTKKLQDNIKGFIIIFKADLNAFPNLGFVSEDDISERMIEHLNQLDLYFIKNSIVDYQNRSLSSSNDISLDVAVLYYNISLDSINIIQFRKPSKFYKGSILIKLLSDREFVIFLHDDISESTKYIKNYKTKIQYNPFNESEIYWGGEDLKKSLTKLAPMMKNGENVYLLNSKPKKIDIFGDSSNTKETGKDLKSIWNNWESTKWSLLAKFADLSVKVTDKDNLKKIQSHENVKWVLNKIQEITPQESKDFLYNQQQYLKVWADKVITDHKKLSKIREFEKNNADFVYIEPRDSIEDLSDILDDEGYLKITTFELRALANSKNINSDIRFFIYPILLGMYSFDSSFQSRETKHKELSLQYEKLLIPEDKEHNFQILKDVYRLASVDKLFHQNNEEDKYEEINEEWDLKNPHLIKINTILQKVTNDEVGYVQGMSDLLIPIYLMYPDDEVTVYYCLKGLLDVIGLRANFREDQSGITSNLENVANLVEILFPELMKKLKQISGDNFVFVYRMILVLFTRENFGNDKNAGLMKFWDYTVAGFRKESQIWIILAILKKHQDIILKIDRFDELFAYFNGIKIDDADEILQISEWIFLKFFETIKRFDFERLKWLTDEDSEDKNDPLGVKMRSLLEQPMD